MSLGPLGEGLPRPYNLKTEHNPKKEKVTILMMMESWTETK
jgi:hypothetical protein